MKNPGKIFEDDFAASVSPDYFLHRLKDSAQSYNNSENTKFAWKNPFDFLLFSGDILYCLELKSTSSKYMGFQIDKNDKSSKIIKWHQIESLMKASKYKNVIAGFVLNFRDEENNMQRTYFMRIEDFNKMTKSINKKSFNEINAIMNGAKKINGVKKRVHWRWNIDEFINSSDDKCVNER